MRRLPQLGLAPGAPAPRSLGERELRAAERFAEDVRILGEPASTLVHPRYWEDR